MPQTILGLPTTEQMLDAGLVRKSQRRGIIRAFPQGGAPLAALLAWAKNEPIGGPLHSWTEKTWIPPRCLARGTAPATSTAPTTGDADDGTALANNASITTSTEIYIKVDSVGLLAVNDVIHLPKWGVTARIIEITRGATVGSEKGYLKVLALRAFTYLSANALEADDMIDVVGSAYSEGSTTSNGRGFRLPITVSNQTQIFRESFEFTGTALKTETEFDKTGIYREKATDAARDHFVKIEKALLFGQRSTTIDAGTNREIRTMSGVLEFLKLYDAGKTGLTIDGETYAPYKHKSAVTVDTDPEKRYVLNADGKVSLDRFERWLMSINLYFNSKTSERLCLCGSNVVRTIGKLLRTQGSYTWQVGQEVMGFKFNRLVTAFGDVVFVTHPLFNENAEYRNSALFLDLWALNYRPVVDRDSHVRKNIQDAKFDGREDEWLGEATLEFWTPANNLFVKNISVVDNNVD